eukprot:CAMPEP_0113947582 /NCGR_PEP_ID=MMETSP1339-20121228/65586_1 /TAXON_ID=94617 /ORGANISM="Fibrocapsa japonica" /LENGTH=195 /DNA_ID=CAMNT_0000954247 /DNA_START=149 /DNA_END=736 /DNA_ORIENTATION=+ /assembly_acc=CAM_ASM_000762
MGRSMQSGTGFTSDTMLFDHVALKVSNITRSIEFYEQMGFETKIKFTTGPARSIWMSGLGANIEIIEVPGAQQRNDPEGFAKAQESRASARLGLTSFALDATQLVREKYHDPNDEESCEGSGNYLAGGLSKLLDEMEEVLVEKQLALDNFIIEPAHHEMVLSNIYDCATVTDPDGIHLQFYVHLKKLPQDYPPEW